MDIKNIVVGDTLESKKSGNKYVVTEIEGDEVTLTNAERVIELDILLEDLPELFVNRMTDV